MDITALKKPAHANSTLLSSDTTTWVPFQRTKYVRSETLSPEDNGIIIGSTLGGTALILVCLAVVLYPIWQRRRHSTASGTPKRTPGRFSKSCASPMPRPSDVDPGRLHRVRPVTPSPRRLGPINASVPSSANLFDSISMGWDLEKAHVHTPSGHPAIAWRGDIFSNDLSPMTSKVEKPPTRQAEPSISSTFAAEMSSLLESISIKSSYSSLRSSGAVLGVPARLQTPLSVQKLRQDSSTTSAGATKGSVSDGGAGGPIVPLSKVASNFSSMEEN
ncbi:hypothetical protein N0V93_006342 [Gnomoniopsis smithogilvyi]|uniref:Uncharacterized protein n=1 Tax=Gnomoniopsis smithogilvyi TaxID=1191159 RepID=A0A9W9CVH9_9PEZI|nr:hypothetical protein N0V93_006342 [Gnomoniopsis smithogilvyi]